MVLALSVLMFVFVTSLLYFLGMKFWVSPTSVVDRVMGEVQASSSAPRHPSLVFRDILEKLGDIAPSSPADVSGVQKKLYRAGFRTPNALKLFLGIKVLATLILPAAAYLLASQLGVSGDYLPMLVVLAAGIGYKGPSEALGLLIKRRRKRIQRALPNALDLLVVCVESGLGLDQAIMQVSRELQHGYPELASELAVANLEMRHGKRRADALRNLAERTGVEDMRKLVSTLIQADRFGTSIAHTLRTHSDFMRLTARQRAEEQAAKIGVKLVFPIFFCILPSLFVVTVGPVIVTIFTKLIPMMEG